MKIIGEVSYSLMGPAKKFIGKKTKGYFKKDIVKVCQTCSCEYKESIHTTKKYRLANKYCLKCRLEKAKSDKEDINEAILNLAKRKASMKK